jgi:FtsZ-interacting cell division protein ZipA
MQTWLWIVIAIGVLAVLALGLWMWQRRRTSSRLRDHFGSEYDRTVEDEGGRRSAESELQERQRRRDELEIRELPTATRRRYLGAWQMTQARFVDNPDGAVAEADRLVTEVMSARGYPMEDFDQRAADISVDHPHLVDNYRSAHRVSRVAASGDADTEDLRRAMVHYRALFEELLTTEGEGQAQAG